MSGDYRKVVRGLRSGAAFQLELSRGRRTDGRLYPIDATGNIFEDRCDVLVCPANERGTTGGGFVHLLAAHYPAAVQSYVDVAAAGLLEIGMAHVVEASPDRVRIATAHARWIAFLPIVATHKSRATLADVDAGLHALARWVNGRTPPTLAIAIPAIGCAGGRLAYEDVLPLIEAASTTMPHAEVHAYAPHPPPGRKRRR